MRKLILGLLGVTIPLLGLLAAGSWLVGTLTRPTESYAEQQARLAREQQSADFWQWVVRVIVALIAIVVLVAVGLVWSNYSPSARWNCYAFKKIRCGSSWMLTVTMM